MKDHVISINLFIYSYMCALSCSSRPAIVLYCFVGRETLCCLCLNKLLCIVLYININGCIEETLHLRITGN